MFLNRTHTDNIGSRSVHIQILIASTAAHVYTSLALACMWLACGLPQIKHSPPQLVSAQLLNLNLSL